MDKGTAVRLYETTGSRILLPSVIQSNRAHGMRAGVADGAPAEGIFYVVRFLSGWKPFIHRFDDFSSGNQHGSFRHSDLWGEYVCPILAEDWTEGAEGAPGQYDPSRLLEHALSMCDYGLPQGRVVRLSGGVPKFHVLHGGNIEPFMGVSRTLIERLFSINGIAEWVEDDRERCRIEDRDALRDALRLPPEENWRAE